MKSNAGFLSKAATTGLHLFFILFSICCIYPLALVFMVSITNENSLILNGYSIIPKQIDFYAYRYIFADPTQIATSYGVTFLVTIVGTIASTLVTSLYAYPLSKREFRHKNLFSFLVYFTMLFSGGLVPWYMVYSKLLPIKDTLPVLIVPLLVTPFYVIMMKTFFATSIPESIMESARIDGAGEYRIFFRIVLPLSLPVLATVGLFNTLGYWNDWYTSLIFITDKNLFTLQFLMYKIMSKIQTISELQARAGGTISIKGLPSETARMAMCIIAIGPIVLAYPFFQKYFIKGLTIGAVKG